MHSPTRKLPEIFCRSFIMPASASAPFVGEGHTRVVQKPQHLTPALMQAQEEVMADASRLPAATLGSAQRGSALRDHP
jgi:hypothetical protein